MIPILVAIWTANYRVYGAHKLWKAARRAGHEIGRDQVARLMRQAGIEGVSRKRRLRTTKAGSERHRGRRISCKRDFTAERTEPVVGHRPDLRADVGRGRVRVFHRRRVLPDDRRLARRRRTCAPGWSSTRSRWRAGHAAPNSKDSVSLRRRQPVHEHPLRRTTRRDRRASRRSARSVTATTTRSPKR